MNSSVLCDLVHRSQMWQFKEEYMSLVPPKLGVSNVFVGRGYSYGLKLYQSRYSVGLYVGSGKSIKYKVSMLNFVKMVL